MSLKDDLASMTVAQLKKMCKERSVKGYSKLTKDELIQAIMAKACEPSLASTVEDPATQQMLQRTSTKKVYSRDESEKRIQNNPALSQKYAEKAGTTMDKVKESNIPFLQKNTEIAGTTPDQAKQTNPPFVNVKPASNKTGGKKKKSTNASARPLEAKEPVTKKQGPKRAASTSQDKAHRAKIGSHALSGVKPPVAAPALSGKKQPRQPTHEPLKKPPSQPTTQEVKEPRLQEQSAGDRAMALKKLSKNVMPILKAHKQDFMRKSTKDLEKLLEMLEIEKSRFTVYQPTDKMLRNFIDESIKLINEAKEEQFNRMEQEYCTKVLPGILKKNEKDVKKIVSQISPYFSETDAAKQIVEKIIKNKSPFPQSYLVTVILKKLRDKSIVGQEVAYAPSKN